jgi:spore maturation protein CgeB
MTDAFNNFRVDLREFDYTSEKPAKANATILEIVKTHKPDLIHMQLQFNTIVTFDTIRKIRELLPNVIISNWTGDMRLPLPSSFKHMGKYVDYSLLSNSAQLNECMEGGARHALYWQIGFDPNINRPLSKKHFKHDGCFIGTNYKYVIGFPGAQQRYDFAELAKKTFGSRFGLYGGNWKEIPNEGGVMLSDVNGIYNDSLCVFSISNFNNMRDYFSDRFLMCMSSGRPTLAWHFPNIENYIQDGVNGVIFSSAEEGVAKMRELVNDRERADFIGMTGARYALENHSYTQKVLELLRITKLLDVFQ